MALSGKCVDLLPWPTDFPVNNPVLKLVLMPNDASKNTKECIPQ